MYQADALVVPSALVFQTRVCAYFYETQVERVKIADQINIMIKKLKLVEIHSIF